MKDRKFFFVIFPSLVCIITLKFIDAMIIHYGDKAGIEGFYNASNRRENTLCDLPKEKKLSMCWEVLHSVKSLAIYPYYFNKNAASISTFECEEHIVVLRTLELIYESSYETEQDMIPCYARHNPMRTGPLIDDYYSYIFITGGNYSDSLFVYLCEQKLERKECSVVGFLRHVGIDNLPNRLPFSSDELEEELQTLKELSFNESNTEIETLYIRSKNFEENKELLNIEDFENTKKMAICEIILEREYFKIDYEVQSVGKDVIISNKWSMEGEKHKIEFWILISENENYNFYETMYPCYTISTDSSSSSVVSSNAKFWISGGFRTNSIIVYKESDNGYNLILFVENWNFDEIE